MKFSTRLIGMVTAVAAVCLSGCASHALDSSGALAMQQNAKTLVVPFTNNSDTPAAGERAASMVAGMLRTRGLMTVTLYPIKKSCNPLNTCSQQTLDWKKINKWAVRRNYEYVVSGDVNEWRYKVGLDGEPSVGTNIMIEDVLSQQVIWTSVGSKTGHSWSGLSDTAQKLFQRMIANLIVER